MNMILKASTRGSYVHACGFGCCDSVCGKATRGYRRRMKRRERAAWKREIHQR